MAKVDEPIEQTDQEREDELTAAAEAKANLAVNPELVADSLGSYLKATLARIKGGESGVLPVVGGLLLVAILFQSLNSHFLTAENLVNLLVQGAVFMLLGMGEVFALLLGEIDLSIGFVSAVGGAIVVELVKPSIGWPWPLAIVAGLVACALIGIVQGTIIARVGLPSFVVTLAGFLFFEGVLLLILGNGGTLPINVNALNDIASGNLTPAAGWIVMIVVVGLFSARMWRRDARRRSAGLTAPPPSLTAAKIVGVLISGVLLVGLCNIDRGNLVPIQGVPWVVLLVLGVLAAWTMLLGRTRFGRYIYAIGGNAEAARRAGVQVKRIKTLAFMLVSFTAAIAGIVYASRLRSVSTSVDGGTLVLYSVAAVVIGGTSLFGGRGKALHAVLGGLVIAAIANGMGLMGYGASAQYIVTALVLLAAVTIDALAHRGRTAGT
jgi:D-xylose transport system permease protein